MQVLEEEDEGKKFFELEGKTVSKKTPNIIAE